jgi:hypothetical protein
MDIHLPHASPNDWDQLRAHHVIIMTPVIHKGCVRSLHARSNISLNPLDRQTGALIRRRSRPAETTCPAFVEPKKLAMQAARRHAACYRATEIKLVSGATGRSLLHDCRQNTLCMGIELGERHAGRLTPKVKEVPGRTMDARELLGYLFAAAALALVFIGVWALSYYSPARTYERELRKERR